MLLGLDWRRQYNVGSIKNRRDLIKNIRILIVNKNLSFYKAGSDNIGFVFMFNSSERSELEYAFYNSIKCPLIVNSDIIYFLYTFSISFTLKKLPAYMLLVLSLLTMYVLTFNTTIQKIPLNQSVYEFGSNWAIDYQYTYSIPIVNQIMLRYLNGSIVKKAKDYGRIGEIVGPTSLANQSNFVFFTAYRKLKLYKFVNNSFSILYDSNNSYFKVVIGKDDFIYTISTDKQKLFKIYCRTMKIQKTVSFSGQQAIDMDFQQKLVIMTKSSSSCSYWSSNCTGKIYLYDQNLQMIKRLNFPGYDFTQHRNIKYDSITNSVVRSSTSSVHLWNFDSTRLVKSVLKVTKNYNDIESSLLCNGYLIVLESFFFSFYRLEDWVKVNTTELSRWQKKRRLKCFKNEKKVGFYSQTLYEGRKQINYIFFQQENIPNLSNAPEDLIPINVSVAINANFTFNDSQLTNATLLDTDSLIIPDQLIQDTLNSSQNALEKTQMKGFTKEVAMAIISNASKSGASVVSSAAGVTSCSSMGKPLLRPVLNLLQDLWFYKYHSIVYPQIVNIFSTQIDILNELRIKPEFLQTQLSIEQFQQQNHQMSQISILQERAPDKILMLQSSKDIYTINLLLVLCSFLLINFFQFLIGFVKQKAPILQIFYNFLVAHSKWWTILIGFFQSNIVPIAFYSSIQFNVFVSFDIFTKFNNVYTILIFFCIFVFSFAFYPVVYQYGKKQQTEELFEFCQISQKSFWLEMTLKCLRGFFQAIFHGFFINRNIVQLSCLIFVDLALLFSVIKFCKKFVRIINFVLLVLYFLIFLAFDCTLFSFSWQNLSQAQITSNSIDQYNFALLILILCLLFVTAFRILAFFGISLQKAITNCKKTNQIQNQIEAEKIKRKQKKSESSKTKAKNKDQKLELDQNLSREHSTRQKISSLKQPQKVGNSKKKLNIRCEKSIKGSNMQIKFMESKNEVDQISQKTTKIGTKRVNVERKRIGTHSAGLQNFKKSNKIQASDLFVQANQDVELQKKNTKENNGKIMTTFRYKSKHVNTIYKVSL